MHIFTRQARAPEQSLQDQRWQLTGTASSAAPAKTAQARSIGSTKRPSLLGYFVLGLAASSLGVAGAGSRTAPSRGAGRLPTKQSAAASGAFDTFIEGVAAQAVDRQPRLRLSQDDAVTECDAFNDASIDSMVNWFERNIQYSPGNALELDLGVPFQVEMQARVVASLVAASPTLHHLLKQAKQEGIRIAWTSEHGRTEWNQKTRTVCLTPAFRISATDAERNPLLVVWAAVNFVDALSHELGHALDPASTIPMRVQGSVSEAVYVENVLQHMSHCEATALVAEFTVAQEIYDETGVIMPVSGGNILCSEGLAIFHTKFKTSDQKSAALAAYMRRIHAGFETFYLEAAQKIWGDAQERVRQGREEL